MNCSTTGVATVSLFAIVKLIGSPFHSLSPFLHLTSLTLVYFTLILSFIYSYLLVCVRVYIVIYTYIYFHTSHSHISPLYVLFLTVNLYTLYTPLSIVYSSQLPPRVSHQLEWYPVHNSDAITRSSKLVRHAWYHNAYTLDIGQREKWKK